MAKYICLRDCFVYDFFHYKDNIYEIPDNQFISEKNFKLAEDKPQEEIKPLTVDVVETNIPVKRGRKKK